MSKHTPAAKKTVTAKTSRRAFISDPTPSKTLPEGDPSADSPMNKVLAASQQGPADQQTAVREAKRHGEDVVTTIVPKTFQLTGNDHRVVAYEAGIIDMPRAHAEHWYAKAQGVEIHKGK